MRSGTPVRPVGRRRHGPGWADAGHGRGSGLGGGPSTIRQSAGRSAVAIFFNNDTSVANSTARALFAHY